MCRKYGRECHRPSLDKAFPGRCAWCERIGLICRAVDNEDPHCVIEETVQLLNRESRILEEKNEILEVFKGWREHFKSKNQ